ncbi:MAG TPA: glycosyltransferase family 2 protein [Thermofilum sp.]|nr:glycosyltransferase family 2 protein [Thermofilum sp.]
MKVSVIIPSYGGGRRLLQLVDHLVNNNHKEKEVIVVIDQPRPEVVKELRKKPVKLILRDERGGKVTALNEAVKQATGDIFIFLDDDVVPNGNGFIEGIVEKMNGYHVAEIRKVIIGKSLLARMVHYDYVGYNYGNYLFWKHLKRCVGFNGAAFVLTREGVKRVGSFKPAVAEDLEFGLRTFLAGLDFRYIITPYVYNDPPPSWRDWFKQRVRWAVGAALWVKDHWRVLARLIMQNPVFAMLILLFLLPSLITLSAALLANTNLMDKIALLVLLSISSFHPGFIPIAAALSYKLLYALIKAVIISVISYFAYSIFYYQAAKRVKLRFNPLDFAIYFFVYSPLWFLMLLSGFIRVFVFRRTTVSDWVVPEEDEEESEKPV